MSISSNELNYDLNKLIKKIYPCSYKNKYNLSHLYIYNLVKDKYLPILFNIHGEIISDEYKNYIIVKVICTKQFYSWREYLRVYTSYCNICNNPFIDKKYMLQKMHKSNKLDILHINSIIIKKNNNEMIIKMNYENENKYLSYFNPSIKKPIKNYKNNHFYLSDFNLSNKNELNKELFKLFNYRNKCNVLHFHLEGNGGGSLIPVHLIVRCLIGKKESWMKNIRKILQDKSSVEWNCWCEENVNNFKKEFKIFDSHLNLINEFENNKKYSGKIHLYIDNNCGSSTWFLITYLIYAFSKKITRYTQKHYGQKLKFGTIESDNLILHGMSGTTSGDGNNTTIKYKNKINFDIPTEQFEKCSIKKKDWNRFWVQNE